MKDLPKLTLGVDVDGTLAATHPRWLELARERYGIDASLEDLREYEFWRLIGPGKEETLELFRAAWDDYERIGLERGAVSAVMHRLHEVYKIYIITASVGRPRDVKSWLKMNDIPYDRFYHTPNRDDKLNIATDMHLEDCGEVAELFASNGRNVVLLSQPWNRGLHRRLKRYDTAYIAKSWGEIESHAMKNAFAGRGGDRRALSNDSRRHARRAHP